MNGIIIFIRGTTVLKNKLCIKDEKQLEEQEKLITLKKLVMLELTPIEGSFDIEHLKKIHKFLFEDIYYFAGELRRCTMAKTTRGFYDPEYIEGSLKEYLQMMNERVNEIQSVRMYACFLSKSYYDLMTIHPFREGNGRSVREFLREFVLSKNDVLPFKVILDFSKMNKDDALKAVEYHYLYPSMLDMEFMKALTVIEKEKPLSVNDVYKNHK